MNELRGIDEEGREADADSDLIAAVSEDGLKRAAESGEGCDEYVDDLKDIEDALLVNNMVVDNELMGKEIKVFVCPVREFGAN